MPVGPLHDKTFVFTGDLSIGRDDAKTKVILLGGRCTTIPSSRTTFLVAGQNPGPQKIKRANELGINILDENGFLKLIEENSKGFDDNVDVKCNSNTHEIGSANAICKELWCEKYRPKQKQDLVGNTILMNELEEYLKAGVYTKAVLLSGQPGIGKTTLAHIICKSLGFDIIEFNASDVRNKSEIANKIRNFVTSRSIFDLSDGGKVLIMDEIDGMSGDMGGISELISTIKETRIPILCICNDRYDMKIRSLVSHCIDLKAKKPDSRQIFIKLKYILDKEAKNVPDGLLNEIVFKSGGDIRYAINMLQSVTMKHKLGSDQADMFIKKTVAKGVFDIGVEVFQRKTIDEKIDLYFEDYSLIPLFVHENLSKTVFKGIKQLRDSFDSISIGDVVQSKIQGANQDWSLAPLHAVYSVVIPTHNMQLSKRLNFPSWLGQNSKHLRIERLLNTFSVHSSCKIFTSSGELRKYALELILKKYVYNLKNGNFRKAIDDMIIYDLTKDDMNNLSDIVIGGDAIFKEIGRKEKILLDKEYKKLYRKLPYAHEETFDLDESMDSD
ncbi:DNA replication factor C complex subunit Rfc1 [Ordospora colligata]|uniref:Replication factor C subunit 1 n=1 Tax=Ordospora colligata OC4 TaxID=1354746 RepID=A0A0B2UKF6_9MICR|nr:DNA replication factor RFC1 [Ordospora colligata OC4]KHN69808.1 DNA replication factor RFC1 [Ordospora colligata OC4]TBU15611.1 DNA replication factor RFC1 [Ordospora colligata]TBU15678.1 DNA replication factor RFC1 [Ordospora colligata]